MSVDERTRHAIHGRFEELLGPELAGAFMSYLPPVGWGDVATKRDLDAHAIATKRDLDALAGQMIKLGDKLDRLTDKRDQDLRTTILAMIGSNATLAGLAFAAARLG